MTRSVLHKLLLARRLFSLARENLNASIDLSLSVGINLLQDAVEMFLLAVSDHVHAGVDSKTGFERYFELINAKITPKSLPFQPRLIALNKLRVNSKHHGLTPARSEVEGLTSVVQEFFEEITTSVLGTLFADASLIDLLENGESKTLLKAAEAAFQREDYAACLIECRKAIFVRIEREYDIASYDTEDKNPLALMSFFYGRHAPFYARNKDYIERNVSEPTDYIVFDHDKVELELMKSGIDSVSFWNVWRLTPAVYQHRNSDEWVIKHEFSKLTTEGIKDRAAYVFDTTINLLVAADQKMATTRTSSRGLYYVDLQREQIPVYKKASSESEILSVTPAGVRRVNVDYSIAALKGEGSFWHITGFEGDPYVWGYISNEEVVGDENK